MSIWIIGEQFEGKLSDVNLELLKRALDLKAGKIGVLLAGEKFDEAELQNLIVHGADTVLTFEDPELKYFRPEPYTDCFIAMVHEFVPKIVLGPATTCGRTWLPYAAMKLHTGLTADCTELGIEPETGLLLQTRPAIGGNIMATIKTPDTLPQMATIRPHSTAKAPAVPGRQGQIIRRQAPVNLAKSNQKLLDFVPASETVELASAEKIIVVGRGVKKPENLAPIKELAELTGCALGATREVVDRGWLPYSSQIGLSGRTVTPKLYIGLGVSGAIQHLAGMQTAEKIIAVNTDPDAQIFSLADVGIVGNLNEVVPALLAQIKKGGKL